jgi:NADH:ubiquinone oxidoreductase subunit 2 (subunit N)
LPKIAVLGFWTHHWHTIWAMSYPFSNGNALILFRAFSMIVGRIRPLAQTNIKRLLAYSSIGHMGVLLMPLCRSSFIGVTGADNSVADKIFVDTPRDSIGVLWAYMIIYIIINRGVWGM